MKMKSHALFVIAVSTGFLSACSQQQVAPATPAKIVKPTPVVDIIPVPTPYPDLVVKPAAPLQPAPLPTLVVYPAPVVKPVQAPPVKVKGNYRGSVPIDERLRQQYQQ